MKQLKSCANGPIRLAEPSYFKKSPHVSDDGYLRSNQCKEGGIRMNIRERFCHSPSHEGGSQSGRRIARE